MQNLQWVNPQHPQTLRIGVILLYFNAVMSIFTGAVGSGIGLVLLLATVGAAVGTANDKRLAWIAGVVVSAIIPALRLRDLWRDGFGRLFDVDFWLLAIFPIALFVSLIHPMSRNYVKTWFE